MCFAMSEKEVKAIAKALEAKIHQALISGCLSQVICFNLNPKNSNTTHTHTCIALGNSFFLI
ncbi:putative homoserine dehydrogenase [Helianthus annuus]|nr:putative homoserine dehydrogenase [Helianthus annuus]